MYTHLEIVECYLETLISFNHYPGRNKTANRKVKGEQIFIPKLRERNHSSNGWNLSNRRREALTIGIRRFLDGQRRLRDKAIRKQLELEKLEAEELVVRSSLYQRRIYLQRRARGCYD